MNHTLNFGREMNVARISPRRVEKDTYEPLLELFAPPSGPGLPPPYFRVLGENSLRELSEFLGKHFAQVDAARKRTRDHQNHLNTCPLYQADGDYAKCDQCQQALEDIS